MTDLVKLRDEFVDAMARWYFDSSEYPGAKGAAAALCAALDAKPERCECGQCFTETGAFAAFGCPGAAKPEPGFGEKKPYCEHVGNSCLCDEYETRPCKGRPKPEREEKPMCGGCGRMFDTLQECADHVGMPGPCDAKPEPPKSYSREEYPTRSPEQVMLHPPEPPRRSVIRCDLCGQDMTPGRVCVTCTMRIHAPQLTSTLQPEPPKPAERTAEEELCNAIEHIEAERPQWGIAFHIRNLREALRLVRELRAERDALESKEIACRIALDEVKDERDALKARIEKAKEELRQYTTTTVWEKASAAYRILSGEE